MTSNSNNNQLKTRLTRSRMLHGFLKGTYHYFILAMVFTLGFSLAEMVRPKIIQYTVDTILVEGLAISLWLPGFAVVGATLAAVLMDYLYSMCVAKGGETFLQQMRDQLFRHLMELPTQWHTQHQTGDIIQRCTTDIEEVKTFLSEQMVTLVRMCVTIALAMLFIFRISWQIGLINLASIPVMVSFSLWFHGRIASSFQICDENESDLSTIAQENLTGVRVVRAFGRERQEQARFSKQNDLVTNSWMKLNVDFSTYFFVADLLTGVIMVVVLSYGSYLCVRGGLTLGELLAIISYLAMLIRPIRSLGRLISEMSKAGVSVIRIYEIMAAEAEEDAPNAVCPAMDQDIEFSHVCFSYPGQPELLHDLSFTIPAGSVLGILGNTGSGKSTIAHLLARLYDLPSAQGKITVGGVDLQQMKASWVRSNVGFVLQEPYLFSRTIAENLAITDPSMTEARIREAARTACLEKAVDDFAKGFDTFVGERGVTLSGGQKQRAAIARTLAQHTPILIFDDSLSAVDAETDAKIRENLKASQAATTILVSHRITTLMAADQILVLEDGAITDRGTHEELISRPGLYRRIYEIQSGKEEVRDEE